MGWIAIVDYLFALPHKKRVVMEAGAPDLLTRYAGARDGLLARSAKAG